MKLPVWISKSLLLLGLFPYSLWAVIQIGETGDPANTLNNQLENILLTLWLILFGISVALYTNQRFDKVKKNSLCIFNKFNLLVFGLILLAIFLNYE